MLIGGAPGTIKGRPYYVSAYAPGMTSGAWVDNQYAAVFGDFRNYWIADLMGMFVDVDTVTLQKQFENQYTGHRFVDGEPILETAFARLKIKA